jgi:hypothetical protein
MTTMLEGLVAQAEAEGAARLTLRALVEEASEVGAKRALELVGLMDASAGSDMVQLRQLIQGWRDAKRSAMSAVIAWVVRSAVALLLLGLAFKLGLLQQGRG